MVKCESEVHSYYDQSLYKSIVDFRLLLENGWKSLVVQKCFQKNYIKELCVHINIIKNNGSITL